MEQEYRVGIPDILRQRGDSLSERAFRILTLRFIDGKDLEETAQIMGLTRERVRQIESKAIHQMRPRLHRHKKIQDFYK